jgi:hypothetical protein
MAKVIKEGFWKSEYEPELPLPVSSDKPIDNLTEFMYKFMRIEEITKWGTMDDNRYILFDCKYAYSNLVWTQYMGYSCCRFPCGIEDREMGDTTIETWYKDDHFIFPSGYRHYIEKHNVHPSAEFYDMIMNFEPKQITSLTLDEKQQLMMSINIINIMKGSGGLRYSE